jgi:uncharacterized damage-inducible protein DinB
MDPRVAPLAEILRLNTKLLRNCLDGFTDETANTRPTGGTNSAAFVAAHVADARYFLLTVLGADPPNPLARYLAGARSIDDVERCPTLDETRAAWTAASDALRERLAAITAAELDAPAMTRFPVDDPSVLGALAFLAQHDSYHIGQLALLRKHAGLPAMAYS